MYERKNIHACVDRLSDLDQQRLRARYARRDEDPDGKELNRFHIALLTAKRWEVGRTLRCAFLDGSDAVQQRVIAKAKKWMDHANIKFEFVSSGAAEIRISFLDEGSWSYLGNDALGIPAHLPTMNYGWLDVGTSDEEYERVVLHEFGHALGCIHEHQNPQGNIPWNRDAVIEYYKGPPNNWPLADIESNLFYRYSKSVTSRTEIDPLSIMMYPIPAEHLIGAAAIQGGSTLTQSDKEFINRMYPPPVVLAPVLTVGGAAVPGTISSAREIDEYTFTVQSSGKYRVGTGGVTDVVLTLLDATGAKVAEDDDSGPGLNPLVQASLTPGVYTARVRHFSASKTGDYTISVAKA